MEQNMTTPEPQTDCLICPIVEIFNETKKDISNDYHLVCDEKYDTNPIFGSVHYFHHHQ